MDTLALAVCGEVFQSSATVTGQWGNVETTDRRVEVSYTHTFTLTHSLPPLEGLAHHTGVMPLSEIRKV